jgi:L-threonylcarbamoyladenylate synthase
VLFLLAMESFEADIIKSLEVLKNGGIILYPTDTVWGLGCDATNEAAVSKIFAIKQRQAANSLIVLVADERDLLKFVSALDLQVFDYLDTVQKPTTVVYDGAIGLAGNVINQDGSVGIRLVKETFCNHLIRRFRKPIVSTSANISGMPAPRIFSEISPAIKTQVDYIVQYRQQDDTIREPSAVVKWKGPGDVEVIRS